MTKDELKNILLEIHPRYRARNIEKNVLAVNFLDGLYPNVNLNIQIHALLNDVSPYCAVCNSPIKFFNKKTCSRLCREKFKKNTEDYYKIRYEKQKKTNIEKYGVEHSSKSAEIQAKRISTMNEKYGSGISPKSREKILERIDNLQIKGRQTLTEKYGVTNPGQLENHGVKIKTTMMKNYGVDHYSKIDKIVEIRKQKKHEKYSKLTSDISLLDIFENEEKSGIYLHANMLVKFVCNVCNTEDVSPTETFKWRIRNCKTPCFKCAGLNRGSRKENDLKDFIKNLGFNIIENKKLLDNKEIDIFIPDINVGFEFDGLFWHNDTRLDKSYHFNKYLNAKNHNMRLIHIFEDEWEHSLDIVKSRIKNILNKTESKIYARKCSIKEISYSVEKEFLEKNHIQGHAKSSVKLGLFYENQLVSVMTFSKPNLSKGHRNVAENTWELLRFSNILNTSVVGSASKLFSYFIKKYNPEKIISYSDNRWNTGDVYSKLGFLYDGETPLNYWYIDPKKIKRIHRFKLRKNKNDDPSLTEYENRLKQGWLRIWDCGNSKWVWNKLL